MKGDFCLIIFYIFLITLINIYFEKNCTLDLMFRVTRVLTVNKIVKIKRCIFPYIFKFF